MSELKLYYSGLCFQSLKIKALLEFCKIPFHAIEVEFGEPKALPLSIYGETPLIEHKGRIVEDTAAIIRYIDEQFMESKLFGSSAAVQAEIFNTLEFMDAEILPQLTAPLLLDPKQASLNLTRSLNLGGKRCFLQFIKGIFIKERVRRYLGFNLTVTWEQHLEEALNKAKNVEKILSPSYPACIPQVILEAALSISKTGSAGFQPANELNATSLRAGSSRSQ